MAGTLPLSLPQDVSGGAEEEEGGSSSSPRRPHDRSQTHTNENEERVNRQTKPELRETPSPRQRKRKIVFTSSGLGKFSVSQGESQALKQPSPLEAKMPLSKVPEAPRKTRMRRERKKAFDLLYLREITGVRPKALSRTALRPLSLPLGSIIVPDLRSFAVLLGFSRDGRYIVMSTCTAFQGWYMHWISIDTLLQDCRLGDTDNDDIVLDYFEMETEYHIPLSHDDSGNNFRIGKLFSAEAVCEELEDEDYAGSVGIDGLKKLWFWQTRDLEVSIIVQLQWVSDSDNIASYSVAICPSAVAGGAYARSVTPMIEEHSAHFHGYSGDSRFPGERHFCKVEENEYFLLIPSMDQVEVVFFELWRSTTRGQRPKTVFHAEHAKPWWKANNIETETIHVLTPRAPDAQWDVGIQIRTWNTLDAEPLLSWIFKSRLAEFHLVDYNIRIVRLVPAETSVLMCSVVELLNGPRSRHVINTDVKPLILSLVFMVHLVTGEVDVIQIMQLDPSRMGWTEKKNLVRPLQASMYLHGFAKRLTESLQANSAVSALDDPDEQYELTNNTVWTGKKLVSLENPVFPIQIVADNDVEEE